MEFKVVYDLNGGVQVCRSTIAVRVFGIGNPERTGRTLVVFASIFFNAILAGMVGAENYPPNIVLMVADDLGYGELGCQGNRDIPTPHIDSIAQRGVRFTDGYVSAAYCSASRAGIMTGRYQNRFGYEFNPIGAQNDDPNVGLPRSEVTLAEHLLRAGYATGLVGKWHLGGAAAYHPLRCGFEEFFGFLHEGHFYVPPPYSGVTTMLRRRTLPGGGKGRWSHGSLVLSTHMGHDEPAYDANNPILRGGQPVEEPSYLTDALTREAVDFIVRNQNRPFFLYLAYNAVHSPLQATDESMLQHAQIKDVHRRIFAGMLSKLDQSVGAVLGKLDQHDLLENTLVFFISDNGGPTRELTSSNRPLRGGKGDVYEGGIRVPFLAMWKGVLPEKSTYCQPAISLDIYATAAQAARSPVPATQQLDGVDLIPYLTGSVDGAPHQELYWRLHSRTALRCGEWKLVKNPGYGKQNVAWELYDLSHDIGEQQDLATVHPEKVTQLKARWANVNQHMRKPFWPADR
jgi:arylsulfatase A-like enzyme